jgi:hypothetical protein
LRYGIWGFLVFKFQGAELRVMGNGFKGSLFSDWGLGFGEKGFRFWWDEWVSGLKVRVQGLGILV